MNMKLDDQLVKAIADAAEADTRSVLRRLLGLKVKGFVSARIDREIAARIPHRRSKKAG